MSVFPIRSSVAVAATVIVSLAACDGATTEPALDELAAPALLGVVPEGGSQNVAVGTAVEVRFSHAMNPAMTEYVALHEGDLDGPEVPGTWRLVEEGRVLRFQPDRPLAPHTRYTIHVGGGMVDQYGRHPDFEQHGPGMGGQWATGEMMQGPHGPAAGQPGGPGAGPGGPGGPGHNGDHPHMGDGWEHANGSYGMIFTFTTGG